MQLDTYEPVNALTTNEAEALRESTEAAMQAMAHFGSDDRHIAVMANLHAVAIKASAEAFKASEKIKAPIST